MRDLILHLGMNKAGSTAIQSALSAIDDPAVHYPDFGPPDQSFTLVAGYMTRWPPRFGQPDEATMATSRAEARARLHTATQDGRNLLLSSEYLSTFRSQEEVDALVADLGPRFNHLRAIVYLREPVAYMTSVLQQAAKGNDVPDDPFDRMYPRYRPRLQRWTNALGLDAVDFVCFDRAAFAQGDLLADFAARAGLTGGVLPPGPVTNEGLSAEAIAVLLTYHRRYSAEGRGPFPTEQLLDLLGSFGDTPMALDPGLLDPVVAAYDKDIEWACNRMGRDFPAPPTPKGRTFAGVPDLRAYGETLSDRLRAWQVEVLPEARPEAHDVASILRAVVLTLLK